MLSDIRLHKRLLSASSVFGIQTVSDEETPGLTIVNVGNFIASFDFDSDDPESISNIILTSIQSLVPPTTTALEFTYSGLGLGEPEWRGFLSSHPEVRSVKCSMLMGPEDQMYKDEPLWAALSRPGTGGTPLCPRLESISLPDDPASAPLLNCLLNRKNAGFELKHLKARTMGDVLFRECRPLVGMLEAPKPGNEPTPRVRFFH